MYFDKVVFTEPVVSQLLLIKEQQDGSALFMHLCYHVNFSLRGSVNIETLVPDWYLP